MTQEKTRQEKLQRILTENKTRFARIALIDTYLRELSYQLKPQQFVDLMDSSSIKRKAYQKVRTLQGQQYLHFREVMVALEGLREQCLARQDDIFVLYYLDSVYIHHDKIEAGGIKLSLKDFWCILHNIVDEPQSDIVFVDETTASGICVEQEEHFYLLTHWGI